MPKTLLAALSILLSLPVLGFAADIQVPDSKTYNEHKEVLKGIVSISEKFNCSAARVGKKVLLTARHCTKFKPNVDHQIKISVNNIPYKVEKIFIQAEKVGEDISAGDVALLLLDRELPNEIPTLKIADKNTKFSSSEYIAAGYGEIDENIPNQYEKINGKFFSAATGDWSSFASPLSSSIHLRSTDPVLSNYLNQKYPDTHRAVIKFNCNTTEYYQNAYAIGAKAAFDRTVSCTTVETFKKAQLTAGDSGGPALMFEENKNLVIVGVASRGDFEKDFVSQSEYLVNAYGLDRLPLRTDKVAPKKTFIEKHSFCFDYNSDYILTKTTQDNWDKANRELIILAKEVFDFKLFKAIALEKMTQNYGISVYASTVSERNSQFLQDGLKELSKP